MLEVESHTGVTVGQAIEAVPSSPLSGRGRALFFAFKRTLDLVLSALLLPLLALIAVALLVLNPFFNPGRLFYVQLRLGRRCRVFPMIKFRTMRPVRRISRGVDDPVENERVTPLGGWLRATRLDELPQIINVLRGEMSLVGPRPDYVHHARRYLTRVPGYRKRHSVRPGITGLAQIQQGYAEGVIETARKVRADIQYIDGLCASQEAWILWRTLAKFVSFRRG